MLRIGLLGAGMIGAVHVEGFATMKSKTAQYTAVCDIDDIKRNEFARKYNLCAYAALDEMLADPSINIVDLCLPSFMHEEFAVKIVRAKKHLLIEKPVAFTLEAARNIFTAARENGVRIMVAQVIRFWPEYVKIKEIYDSGAIGDIITVYAARLGQIEVENYNPYGKEIEYFAECAAAGKDPETVSEQSVMQVLMSILAAKESLHKGEIRL